MIMRKIGLVWPRILAHHGGDIAAIAVAFAPLASIVTVT
jgi:hypothetical protein